MSRSTTRLLCASSAGPILLAVVAVVMFTGAGARGHCTISGTAAADRLVGTPKADVICGGPGGDTIVGNGGNDVIYGGSGNDVVYPGAGSDRVFGDAGSDLVFSLDSRRDVVDGGSGVDRGRLDPKIDRKTGIEGLFPATRGKDPVLIAAGDIADCSSFGALETAPLLDAFPYAPVLTIGDLAYPSGTPDEFARCYTPTWGRAKARTRPTPGNHEYRTSEAKGYFTYFGSAAANPSQGWYSFDLGAWHVVSLNSNCEFVSGCGQGSPQERWLRADLAAHPQRCTLAYWHHPFYSSGEHGNSPMMAPIWQALYDANADLVLVGHDHDYERFAPQNTTGEADPVRGIREIVVGTGGVEHAAFTTPLSNSQVRNNSTFGVLKLTLGSTRYSWKFVPEAGKTFTDSGSTACH
jgi:hemolysin type calcium-binding protein/calcineurin-like phosphoesterase family protein